MSGEDERSRGDAGPSRLASLLLKDVRLREKISIGVALVVAGLLLSPPIENVLWFLEAEPAMPQDVTAAYVDAGRLLRAGESPYSNELYLYPPTVAALLSAPMHLGADSQDVGRALFGLLFVVYLATIVLPFFRLGRDRMWSFAVLLLALVVLDPFQAALREGNIDGLILLCVLGAFLLDERGYRGSAGLIIGFGAALKLTPLFPALGVGLFYARRGRRRFGLSACIMVAVCWCLTPESSIDYFLTQLNSLGSRNLALWSGNSLAGWLYLAGASAEAAVRIAFVLSVALAVTAGVFAQSAAVAWGISCVGVITANSIVWSSYPYAHLLVPLLIAIDRGPRSVPDLMFACLVWVGWALLGFGLLESDELFRWVVLGLHLASFVWAALLLARGRAKPQRSLSVATRQPG